MAKREERTLIAIIGRTNAGKSSLLNVLSGQKNFAIVDSAPGTTADTVIAPMEIHGLGPCKILDTAGVDEFSSLGNKKRKKTYEAIEEADLSLLVLDLAGFSGTKNLKKELEPELGLIDHVKRYEKQVLMVHNLIRINRVDPKTVRLIRQLDQILKLPSVAIEANKPQEQRRLADFIKSNFRKESRDIDLLPMLKNKGIVLLIIPMDEETPTLRLLRPQDMVVERLLRSFMIPVLFRLNLTKARSQDPKLMSEEKKRFDDLLSDLGRSSEGLALMITDSQAFDIVSKWTPEKIPLTSFSIVMTRYMAGGNLEAIRDGVKALDSLKPGDRVLIAEACNHDRKCDDIATVQLPRLLEKKADGKLKISFSFGRTFPENLKKFKLIVHCGACMIDKQKYQRRLKKAQEAGIPFTNYGFVLSFAQNRQTLERVLKPFE